MKRKGLTARRGVLLLLLLVFAAACSGLSDRSAPTARPHALLVEARFEPSWMERDAWSLRIYQDGAVEGVGRRLGRVRKHLPEPAMEEIVIAAHDLAAQLAPGPYLSSTVEDADVLELRVALGDRFLEYKVDDPRLAACTPTTRSLARLWNLLIVTSAPKASCNGEPCAICNSGDVSPERRSADPGRPAG